MILQIENTAAYAQTIANIAISDPSVVVVFDLDGVLLDASHRIKLRPDGSLDLAAYRADTTAEKVAQDKDLPLMAAIHALNAAKRPYFVATARVLCEHTLALLSSRGVRPVVAFGRDGDSDTRKDADLKAAKLSAAFPPDWLTNLLIIDDHLPNCEAVVNLGGTALQVRI